MAKLYQTFAVIRLLRSQSADMPAYDPSNIAGSSLLLLLLAPVAFQIPAGRGTKAYPAATLRHESTPSCCVTMLFSAYFLSSPSFSSAPSSRGHGEMGAAALAAWRACVLSPRRYPPHRMRRPSKSIPHHQPCPHTGSTRNHWRSSIICSVTLEMAASRSRQGTGLGRVGDPAAPE